MSNVTDYASFLVRLWLEPKQQEDRQIWRFEVESIQTGELLRFDDAASLVEFLQRNLPPSESDHMKQSSQ